MQMKHILCLCLFITLSLNIFAGDTTDAKAVQGTWIPVKADLGGHPMPDAVLKMITLKMDKGEYVVMAESADKGTYTLDATTQPKSITVTGTNGPNLGKTFPAIYELKGDTLRICYDLSGVKRPSTFASAPGTKLYLVTYQRKKE